MLHVQRRALSFTDLARENLNRVVIRLDSHGLFVNIAMAIALSYILRRGVCVWSLYDEIIDWIE